MRGLTWGLADVSRAPVLVQVLLALDPPSPSSLWSTGGGVAVIGSKRGGT